LIGIISGIALMIGSVILGGETHNFFNLPALMIVLGGTLAATTINYPVRELLKIAPILRVAFTSKKMEPSGVISTMVSFAEKARREGLLALEDDTGGLDDQFLRKGIQLVIDGTDPELVRSILDTELAFLSERHKMGQSIFETMGSLSPSFGMIGTLIGLVQMLSVIDDPEAIGPGLATALITTLYGVIMANLVFIPIAGKLKVRSEEEILLKEVMIEGMLSIQAGENPRIVEEKLKAFLAPEIREDITDDETGRVVVETDAQEAL